MAFAPPRKSEPRAPRVSRHADPNATSPSSARFVSSSATGPTQSSGPKTPRTETRPPRIDAMEIATNDVKRGRHRSVEGTNPEATIAARTPRQTPRKKPFQPVLHEQSTRLQRRSGLERPPASPPVSSPPRQQASSGAYLEASPKAATQQAVATAVQNECTLDRFNPRRVPNFYTGRKVAFENAQKSCQIQGGTHAETAEDRRRTDKGRIHINPFGYQTLSSLGTRRISVNPYHRRRSLDAAKAAQAKDSKPKLRFARRVTGTTAAAVNIEQRAAAGRVTCQERYTEVKPHGRRHCGQARLFAKSGTVVPPWEK